MKEIASVLMCIYEELKRIRELKELELAHKAGLVPARKVSEVTGYEIDC